MHDVYEQISATFSDSRYRAWPRVKQFLMDLEPGAIVCDVGKDQRGRRQGLEREPTLLDSCDLPMSDR